MDLQSYGFQITAPIIEAEGGIATTWSRGSPDKGSQIIVGGDRELHKIAIAMLARASNCP